MTSLSLPLVLRGTPVVPGVAYAPVVLATTSVAAHAVTAFEATSFPDPETALAAYDAAATATSEGLVERAGRTSGAAAGGLTPAPGAGRGKGPRAAVRKRLRAGDPLLTAVRAAVDEFAGIFTQVGGTTAERVTDLR